MTDLHTPPTLADAVTVYLTNLRSTRSHHVNQAYNQALAYFLRFLHSNYRIGTASIQANHTTNAWAEAFLTELQANHAVETEHLYTRAILDFYRFLSSEQLAHNINLAELEAHFTARRRRRPHQVPELPTQAIQQLIEFAARPPIPPPLLHQPRARLRYYRDRAFIFVLAETGLRLTETCNLRRRQLDLNTKFIELDTHYHFNISTTTITLLKTYLDLRGPYEQSLSSSTRATLHLFARHDKRAGNQILGITRWTAANIIDQWVSLALAPEVCQELVKQGQKITAHSIRHYFIIETLNQTNDLGETQRLARHLDSYTTRQYLNILDRADETNETSS